MWCAADEGLCLLYYSRIRFFQSIFLPLKNLTPTKTPDQNIEYMLLCLYFQWLATHCNVTIPTCTDRAMVLRWLWSRKASYTYIFVQSSSYWYWVKYHFTTWLLCLYGCLLISTYIENCRLFIYCKVKLRIK